VAKKDVTSKDPRKPAIVAAPKVRYWTYAHNVEDALRNGSFLRQVRGKDVVRYMNGDFMGEFMGDIPASKYAEVTETVAKSLIPKCCL